MIEEKHPFTFTTPNVLLSATVEGGALVQSVREGGPKAFEATTTRELVEVPIEETPFVIRATNRINFAGGVIDVINDEILHEDRQLRPTSPTASEYLAKIGQPVMIAFSCRYLQSKSTPDKKVYAVGRTFITLR